IWAQYFLFFLTNPPLLAITSKSRRYNKMLNKIVNINEDCSEDTSVEDQYELGQSEADSEISEYTESGETEGFSEYTESGETEGSSNNEDENFLKVHRNKETMMILSSSDSEDERTSIPSASQNVMGEIEISIDGTQWINVKRVWIHAQDSHSYDIQGCRKVTGYAKRNIISGCITSSFELIIE
ncbi:uncharacterized protein LOC112213898, partial [Bombus impatiens]|uniref:Uncharacterized protein LOC112213898 n=1 Tax=Bombus impatiens TaxID=132113 RepID=A0A6P8LDL9_BOMIM